MAYLFGGDTNQSQGDITDARKRLAYAMLQQGTDSSPVKSNWEGAARLAQALVGGMSVKQQADDQRAADAQLISAITGQPYTPPAQSGGFLSSLFGGSKVPASDAQTEVAAGNPSPVSAHSLGQGDVYDGFMNTVKGTITNPYGLAAVAATGSAESGFSPENAGRTWSDPSESGQPGTAGGIMSWRGPRYAALAATGDLSPQGQAKFFLQEDPNLIAALNNAKSVEEAQTLMNNAWAFKGYNRPGGEAGRRLATAQSYLPRFQGTQVASADPTVGMPPAAAPPAGPVTPPPINAPAPVPTPGYTDPKVTTAFRPDQPQTPAEQAIQTQAPVPQPRPMEVASLDPAAGGAPAPALAPPTAQQAALPPLPSGDVGPAPQVASVPSVPDQQQAPAAASQPGPVRLAQALDGAPQESQSPMANPRAQALVKAIMNPNASPQVRALATQQLQTLMRPPEYGFQTLPDGTIMRTDPRTGTVDPIYQATPKPVEVNGRLVDPVSGKVIADFSDPSVSSVDGALIDNRTGQPLYKSSPKGMSVEPGSTVINPQTGEVLYQGTGFKPEDVTNMRKEIQGLPSYKSFQQALPSYQSMIDTAKTDSKASDLNLVYGLGKIMDPNSVVREGEMVMVNNTSSLPDWVQGAINSVNGGSRLEPATRMAILSEARSRMMAYRGALDNDIGQYQGIISRRGMNAADILPTLGSVADVPQLANGTPAPAAPPAPAPAAPAVNPADIPPAPAGIDAEDWKYLTPEQRRLWQK